MKNLIKTVTLASVLILAVFTLTGCGGGETIKFIKPSIKDNFCGPVINYQYFKCAFHDKYCDVVGMSDKAAKNYIYTEYGKWIDKRREEFKESCINKGGIINGDKCKYCADDQVAQANKCVKVDDEEEEDKDDNDFDSTAFVADGPFDSDCNINESEFNEIWKKYSDFDDRIDFSSRSWETQQNLGVYEKIMNLKVRNFELERDMEIDRQLRLTMREYKVALVQNIRTNLLKSFWRLSYVTYTTIKSAKGLGGSYSTVLTSAETIPRISAGLKVIQGVIPSDSRLAIDTKTASGKVKSAALVPRPSIVEGVSVMVDFAQIESCWIITRNGRRG